MSSNNTITSSSPFINISIRINDKVISNISPSSGHRMIFINRLKLLLDGIDTSREQFSIILCGMMDNNLCLIFVNTLWPLEIIAIIRFTHFIYSLFRRIGIDDKIVHNLRLVLLLEDSPQLIIYTASRFIIRSFHLFQFTSLLFFADSISLTLGQGRISDRLISSPLFTRYYGNARQIPICSKTCSPNQSKQQKSENIFFIHIYKVENKLTRKL